MLRRKSFVALTAVATLFALGVIVAGLTWAFVCSGSSCPSLEGLEQYQPRQTSRLYAADNRFIAEIGLERRTLVKLEQIPPHVREAFVVTEDKRFSSHGGIDFWRVLGAGIANLRAGGISQGFSTITMQLARNLFPASLSARERTLGRKLREAKVARAIEARYSKDRILELYLNQIYLGNGAYGVETASHRYFGKSVRELNLAEAAMLAALPKAPERYNPRRFPDRAVQRRNTVLALMRRAGAISDADASLARAYPLRLAHGRGGTGDTAPYFVEWVRRFLADRFGKQLYEQGLKVYTTLDLDLQGSAERALDRQLRAVESGQYGAFTHPTYEQFLARAASGPPEEIVASPYLQGAFVALDPRTGAVRALVGGRDFDDSKFDRTTQALRQPGSTFKPIVYATAIQSGRPPSYLVEDAPIEVPQLDSTKPWLPQNYDLEFQGPMTMRRGLYNSRNLVAIRVGMELGEQSVVEMAKRFGITTPVPPYPSIHIGSADVYPIEMIAVYSVFANLGWRVSPQPIIKVENEKGEVLWKPEPTIEPVLSREEAWLMVHMMKDVIRRGTAFASVWNAGFHLPAGGKTGTTNDYTDVWFIGYTADLVAGVWMGFDKPQRIMANAQGGRLAAPAWTTFMREVYERKPAPPDWPRPSGLISRLIDEPSGLLHGPLCPMADAYVEYFIPGTEPTQTCGLRLVPSMKIP